jgi:serine/threonine protein kinase
MSVTSSGSNGSVPDLNEFNYNEEDIIVTSSFKQKNCLGRGGFGFVFKDTSDLECQPRLPSELKNANSIGKVMRADKANEEFGKYQKIANIDSKEEFSLTKSFLCRPKNDGVPLYDHSAENPKSKCDPVPPLINPLVNIYKYGGISLDKHLKVLLENGRENPVSHDYYDGLYKLLINLANVLRGLVAYHENGIYHRDIKEDNLVINDEGLIRMIDFGLSVQYPLKGEEPSASNSPFLDVYASQIGSHIPCYSFLLSYDEDARQFNDKEIKAFCDRYMFFFSEHYLMPFLLMPFSAEEDAFSAAGNVFFDVMKKLRNILRDGFIDKTKREQTIKKILNGFDVWGFGYILVGILCGPIDRDFKKVLLSFIRENEIFNFEPSDKADAKLLFRKYKDEVIPILTDIKEKKDKEMRGGGIRISKNKLNKKSLRKSLKGGLSKKNKLSKKKINKKQKKKNLTKYGGGPQEPLSPALAKQLYDILNNSELENQLKNLKKYPNFEHMQSETFTIKK